MHLELSAASGQQTNRYGRASSSVSIEEARGDSDRSEPFVGGRPARRESQNQERCKHGAAGLGCAVVAVTAGEVCIRPAVEDPDMSLYFSGLLCGGGSALALTSGVMSICHLLNACFLGVLNNRTMEETEEPTTPRIASALRDAHDTSAHEPDQLVLA